MKAYILTAAETVTECSGDPFVLIDHDDMIIARRCLDDEGPSVDKLNPRQARLLAYRLCVAAEEVERGQKR